MQYFSALAPPPSAMAPLWSREDFHGSGEVVIHCTDLLQAKVRTTSTCVIHAMAATSDIAKVLKVRYKFDCALEARAHQVGVEDNLVTRTINTSTVADDRVTVLHKLRAELHVVTKHWGILLVNEVLDLKAAGIIMPQDRPSVPGDEFVLELITNRGSGTPHRVSIPCVIVSDALWRSLLPHMSTSVGLDLMD